MIPKCISSPTFSFMVNGNPRGFVKSSKELWQGDPLSRSLFQLVMDVLSKMLLLMMVCIMATRLAMLAM